ncbi:anti-sigma-I factor RsgI family protein [Pseudobacteroides sp.]|uniref:anti-sigma-I factor RsgI family protein n=1 Tax=Pseudobacteroides sp. TaxID=1968840 RepID=UPI002F944A44
MNLYRVGYIFSILSSDVIVMTEDLDFYKLKKRSDMIELGQEICFSDHEIISAKSRKPNYLRIGAIASGFAAAIVLLCITFYTNFIHSSSEIYAYIDVDTNLSVRLNIDKQNKVVKVDSNNTSTRKIIGSTDLKNKSLSDALTTIVEKSKQLGFTTDNKEEYLVISASIKPDGSDNRDQSSLDSLVQNVRKDIKELDSLKINKRIIKVDSKTYKIASENNISMGRYITYIESKSKGINMSIEDIREGSIGGIIKKADMSDITNNTVADKQNVVINEDIHKNENTLPKYNNRDDKPKGNEGFNQSNNQGHGDNNTSTGGTINTPIPRQTPNISKNTPVILTFEYPTPTAAVPTYDLTKLHPVPTTPVVPVYTTPSFTNKWPSYTESKATPTPKRQSDSPIHTSAAHTTPAHVLTPSPLPTFGFTSPVEISINPASEITSSSAFISGKVIKFEQNKYFYGGNCNISLVYWETSNPMYVKMAASIYEDDFPADISATIKGLKPNTSYQFKVVVNMYFGSTTQTFTTLAWAGHTKEAVSTTTPSPSMPSKIIPTPKNPWVFPTPIPPIWFDPPKMSPTHFTYTKPEDINTPYPKSTPMTKPTFKYPQW